MEVIAGRTQARHRARRRGSGDPSPWTALGCEVALRVTCERAFGTDDLQRPPRRRDRPRQRRRPAGRDAARGRRRARRRRRRPEQARARRAARRRVDRPAAAHDRRGRRVAPCALGGVLNDETVPALRCKAIAGAANNQLASDALDEALAERGILWAPDFVCNAGGIINIAVELEPEGYSPERADAKRPRGRRHAAQDLRHRRGLAARRRCSAALELGRERLSAAASSRPSSRSFSRCARSVIAANGRTRGGRVAQAASSSSSSLSRARLERRQQLALALGAVGEVLVELRGRVGHLVAVARADDARGPARAAAAARRGTRAAAR